MRTIFSYFRECFLMAVFLMAIPHSGQAFDISRFRARCQTRPAQSLRLQAAASDTLELSGMGAIYALSIDAVVQQPREASFVRIVLEDSNGHDYLVAESDRFRNDSTTVHLYGYCEETAQLEGIIPVRLKCYLAGDATVNISNLYTATEPPTRGQTFNAATRTAMRESQVEDIVERINAYNCQHGKLWRAGVNSRALMDYRTQEDFGETDAYIANFKYYTEGIYEMGERPTRTTPYQSPYVDSFDWRNRHGKNWVGDSIRNQGTTSLCTVFSTIGMLEAVTNLYFNDTIYLDLSEQDLLYNLSPSAKTDRDMQCIHISSDSVIDELSEPFMGSTSVRPHARLSGIERVSCCSSHFMTKTEFSNNKNLFEDELKRQLILYGPCSWGYSYPKTEYIYGTPVNQHYMTLIGYGTVHNEDTCTLVTSTSMNTGSMPDSVAGQTYWIFKDSYGHATDSIYHHNGYRYILFNDFSRADNKVLFLNTPIFRRDHTDEEILCEDNDGDGYFNWGIGERPNALLPAWAEQEPDGDDTNDYVGYLNSYGHSTTISYLADDSNTIINGMNGDILCDSIFQRDYFYINDGATVSVTGTIVFSTHALIDMGTSSTLIIDGGTIVNPTFRFLSNSSVILNNGGKIVFTRHQPNFTFPVGLSLTINEGKIEYLEDFR